MIAVRARPPAIPVRRGPAAAAATTRPPSTPTPTRTVRHSHVEEPDIQPARPWQLVLIDDNDHSYEYVIEMLGRIFGYGKEKAFALARIVDTHGRVTLMTGEREACEAKQSQVHAYGADPRIAASKGSMTAVLEQLDAPSP